MGGSWTGIPKVTVVLGLAGLLGILGSVEMREGRNGPSPDSLVKSERKRAGDGRTAGADGRTRVEREPRSLEELQEEFERFCRDVGEANGREIYLLDPANSSPEVQAWLEGFTDEEIVLLSKGLFQEGLRNANSRDSLTKHSLKGILVAAWGREDPLDAFAFVDGHEDDYTHSVKMSFKAWIYAGWTSENPEAAWSHFEPGFKAGDWGKDKSSNDGYLEQHIASIILGKWAKGSPEKVWDLVNEQGEDLGFQPKVWNAVIEGLSNGREWETIAGDLEDLWSKGALEPRSLEEARVS